MTLKGHARGKMAVYILDFVSVRKGYRSPLSSKAKIHLIAITLS